MSLPTKPFRPPFSNSNIRGLAEDNRSSAKSAIKMIAAIAKDTLRNQQPEHGCLLQYGDAP